MPSRLMSLLILIYWSIAAFCLLNWDVLPELTMGYPPDLRGIAFASESAGRSGGASRCWRIPERIAAGRSAKR